MKIIALVEINSNSLANKEMTVILTDEDIYKLAEDKAMEQFDAYWAQTKEIELKIVS